MTTPMRAVKRQSPQTRITEHGAHLHLECGHVIWHGGRRVIPSHAECIMGPCYRPQIEYGTAWR